MKVVSYFNVVPSKNKSQEKHDILTKFIEGVNAAGDTGILHQGNDLINADVGFIQGWQHESGKNATHLRLRQSVIDRTANTHVCTADANLFLYANGRNAPHHYLRYSFNGVFRNTGNYFDDNVDPARWQQISTDCDIQIEDTKKDGVHILICAQRDKGWAMGTLDLNSWIFTTCQEIRKYSNRPIVIRLHPGDRQTQSQVPQMKLRIQAQLHNVTLSTQKDLDDDLKNCHAVVNHNSSSIVGPVVKGFSAFITDPIKSQCAEVAHTDFSLIDTPIEFDRLAWLERISMFHWKFSELVDGSAWKHIRQYV
jgi:hypothetical protein|tara:strand:+ start:1682 stop:2608 length:927 start_codon:yes stop_codon:yes gene_type:complete